MSQKEVKSIRLSTNPDDDDAPTFDIQLETINQKKCVRLDTIKNCCNNAAICLQRSSTVGKKTILSL